ncbi:hypothetical protein I0P70_02395 [Pontibacter sp. FD36]|uniref:hypothetical protein n=1 Tax=Pontibacter sp. FD36 TaxID=2789860 RepID=UPI0018AA6997|nr:hypothetical protein [Pontibacter sp. FD36]MBF8962084.1 hypothetical protein [Pontibacter sp. FD36]
MKQLIPKKYLLPLLCLSFLFSSCKKELEEVEVDPVVAWEAHQKFLYNQRFIANLHAAEAEDRLQVLGMYIFSRISHARKGAQVSNYVHPFRDLSHYKYPMNSNIFTGAEDGILYFRSVSDPVTSGANLRMYAKEIDPDFLEFELVMSNALESMAISENNVALVPYRYANEKTGRSSLRYFLVKLGVDKSNQSFSKIVLEEIKILTPAQEGGFVRYMRSHQNNFYVATDWGFYKITEEGEIDFQMPDQVAYATFEHKGDLYAIARHGRQQTHALFRSVSGQSWSLDAHTGNAAEWFNYIAISDDVILAFRNSQIFEVEVGIDKLQLRELANTGLVGHMITAIAKVKNKIYIGTQSGLFSKAAEHLLTYKEEEKK